jgi:hypothetical protein
MLNTLLTPAPAAPWQRLVVALAAGAVRAVLLISHFSGTALAAWLFVFR